MYVCIHVCMFVYMYVCLYAMLLLLDALHLGLQTFRGSSTTNVFQVVSLFFLIHPHITLSMNNHIKLFLLISYNCQLLHTIVDSVMSSTNV